MWQDRDATPARRSRRQHFSAVQNQLGRRCLRPRSPQRGVFHAVQQGVRSVELEDNGKAGEHGTHTSERATTLADSLRSILRLSRNTSLLGGRRHRVTPAAGKAQRMNGGKTGRGPGEGPDTHST